MADKVRVDIPRPEQDKPAPRTIGLMAAGGLLLGIAWPAVAGLHVGPHVPGSKKGAPVPTAVPAAPTASASAPSSAAVSLAAASPAKPSAEQRVVVSSGTIRRCYKKKERKKIEPELCGTLRGLDNMLVPNLAQLKGCPSALGLRGTLELGFDIDFDRHAIAVRRGKKSELPPSTVRGIIACAADYVRDVAADKVAHDFSRYHVRYTLEFYPPGTGPATEVGSDDEKPADTERDLAAVSWDTALVRDEPRNGRIVARVVRGTRVKLMGRRKDWYRVKVGNKSGWVYRGALGL